jgi:MoxR-like ATPase
MEERQITIGESTFNLDSPFLVLATQNPLEQEGTYPLPEAQVDRFLFKVKIGYPTREEEALIMKNRVFDTPITINPVVTKEDILKIRETCSQVHVDEKIRKYIVDIVFATREPQSYSLSGLKNYISCGASPRSSIYLEQVSKVHALLQGRSFVIPQDIKDIGEDILRHRILLSYEAQADGVTSEDCICQIFDGVDVP